MRVLCEFPCDVEYWVRSIAVRLASELAGSPLKRRKAFIEQTGVRSRSWAIRDVKGHAVKSLKSVNHIGPSFSFSTSLRTSTM